MAWPAFTRSITIFIMLTSDVRKLFQRETQGLGHRESGRYNLAALEVFDQLAFPGGEVETAEPLKYARAELLALASWQDDQVRQVFGLDGGSSRTMTFRNGTTACANQALLICEQGMTVEGVPLEAFRTLSWVSHNRDYRTVSGAHAETHERVTLWRLQLSNEEIPATANPQRIQEVVKAMADVASEPQHAVRMAQRLNLGGGDLVFLDGRFYPTRLYRYLISGMGRGADVDIDLLGKGEWKQLIQSSLEIVHLALERGVLFVAINKTPESSALLRFGADKRSKGLWHNDRQWVSALFEKIPQGCLGYTSWFVQSLHPALQGGSMEAMDLFQELSDELMLKLPASAYHIAFFYVYDPRVSAALRVELPRLLLERYGAERLRLLVLSHIARGKGGVPNAIRIADAQAHITQEERQALQQQSGLTPDWDFNHSRGAPR